MDDYEDMLGKFKDRDSLCKVKSVESIIRRALLDRHKLPSINSDILDIRYDYKMIDEAAKLIELGKKVRNGYEQATG